jgi:hypothetical protein
MVDSTDINKARTQTGQAFSILGQATGAEYKRRRKEEEDYQRRMMRDKFKYGLISAAISPAVQAFGQSASDFAGDLVFGEEENFFKDTEEGRQASYIARLNEKRLEELKKTRDEILKEGRKQGSIEVYGVNTILEERKKAVQSIAGGPDENLFINEYMDSKDERASALAEWEKQWGELNDGIKTLKAAPSLAEMEAAYKKTAIGKSRGRQAFGRALSWLKGKDYEADIRRPAIRKILTAGLPPGQTEEWLDISAADLEKNYLTASNVVEGLDAYAEKLLEDNKPLGESLKAANDARKEKALLSSYFRTGNTEALMKEGGYTQTEVKKLYEMPGDGTTVARREQVQKYIRDELSSGLAGLVLNSTAAQHKDAGISFFSYAENADIIDKLRQEAYELEIAKVTGKAPTQSYEEYQAKASKPEQITRIANVEAVVSNFTVQLSTEAERMLLSDMSANPDNYYIPNDPLNNLARRDQAKYEFMQLIIDTKMATEKPDIEPITARSGVNVPYVSSIFGRVGAREAFVPEEILNGKITRDSLSKEVREALKADQEEQNNPLGLTPEQIADSVSSQQSTSPIPNALIANLDPPTLTALNRQIKDMDGTGVLSAKGLAIRKVVSVFDAEYDKNPKQAVSKLRELMSTGSRSIEDLPPRIQNLLGESEKRPFIDMGFTPVSEIPAFQSLLSQPSLKEEGLFADMGKVKDQRRIKSLDSNIAELQRQISGDRVTKNTRAAKVRQQKLDALIEERASLGEAPVVTSDITDILSEKLSLDKGISSASVGKNTKAFKARLEQQDELASALAAMPVKARQIAEAIKGVRNIDSVSDTDLKKTLTSAYGEEITNQVLALLSV